MPVILRSIQQKLFMELQAIAKGRPRILQEQKGIPHNAVPDWSTGDILILIEVWKLPHIATRLYSGREGKFLGGARKVKI